MAALSSFILLRAAYSSTTILRELTVKFPWQQLLHEHITMLYYIILYYVICTLHDHPYYRVCPDILSLVCNPLSGNRCGSPNHTVLVISFCLFTSFILDIKKRRAL